MTEITGDGTAVRTLGGDSGFGEIVVPAVRYGTFAYDVSSVFEDGFLINGERRDASIYINVDGSITFGGRSAFGAEIDAFRANIDPNGGGLVPDGRRIYVDIDPESEIVTVTWYAVTYGYSNRGLTNTFQIQLYNREGDEFDVVSRYDDINWNGCRPQIGVSFGPDTLFYANAGDAENVTSIDDRPGNTGVAGLYIYEYDPLEYATGTEASEELRGTNFNDRMNGLEGNDTLLGGAGDDELQGADGNDLLVGSSGADTLNGGEGTDTLQGGTGEDRYEIVSADDVIIESFNNGEIDRVFSNVSWTLGANTERVKLMGEEHNDATGNELDNLLIGNNGDNVLRGMAGADRVDGRQGDDTLYAFDGDGQDTLLGGAGDDVFHLPAGGLNAQILEQDDPEFGTDLIIAAGSFDMRELPGVENLTLMEGGDFNVLANDGTNVLLGNASANVMRGFGGNDTINGRAGDDIVDGGEGADLLIGGQGSDLIIVDHVDDRVAESRRWEGNDTVEASVDFRMGRKHIEDLTLTGEAIVGAGNGLQNVIRGNREANILDGGKNNDTLMGGAGNDTYLVRAPGDIVIEAVARGEADTVKAYRAYELTANVERLFLQTLRNDEGEGVTGINGIGNDLDNVIVGNPFDNVIVGREGNDTLRGQAGSDTFVFDREIGADNVDTIVDFNTNTADEGDLLRFKRQEFSGVSRGELDADQFVAGSMAADADDRFIFDRAEGYLWFDADGSGAGMQQLVAVFERNANVTAADIEIF